MKKIKICYILSGFFPDNKAGTEIYVKNLAKALPDGTFDVSILIPSMDVETEYEYEGLKVYTFLEEAVPGKKVFVGLADPPGLKSFTRRLIQISPEIAHFHTNNRIINSRHMNVARKLGMKIVFTAHLSGIFCHRGDLQYMAKEQCDGVVRELKCTSCVLHANGMGEKKAILTSGLVYLYNRLGMSKLFMSGFYLIRNKKKELQRMNHHCHSIIAISEWIENTYKANHIGEIILIPQAIDPGSLPASKQYHSGADRLRILFMGRLTYIKGLHILLSALSLHNLQSRVHLLIAGIRITTEEAYYNEMRLATKALDSSEWLENVPQHKLGELLGQTDVVCIPSLVAEMAPLSILEAASFQVPVIGTDLAGISDMVEEESSGLLFPFNNELALFNCIKRLLDEPELLERMRKNVQNSRPYAAMIAKHTDLYKDLL